MARITKTAQGHSDLYGLFFYGQLATLKCLIRDKGSFTTSRIFYL